LRVSAILGRDERFQRIKTHMFGVLEADDLRDLFVEKILGYEEGVGLLLHGDIILHKNVFRLRHFWIDYF